MTIVFTINGGIGKCIAATAVCEVISKKYVDARLVVVSAYPEVFINNQFVSRSFSFNDLNYFYADYVEDKEIKVFAHDPYLETKFIKQEDHLIKIWCEMFGLEYNNEKPSIFLTNEEINTFKLKFLATKPILVLQTNGGAIGQTNKYSWARDIPDFIINGVIKEFSKTHFIAHIRREDQTNYENTIPITDNFRSICVLLCMSDKRLLMDSFAQHAAAAFLLPSTVLWVANKPNVFGYNIHTNIVANPETKKSNIKGSFLQKYDITGDLSQFPYNNQNEMFNLEEVIAALKK